MTEPIDFVKRYYQIFDTDRTQLTLFYVRLFRNSLCFQPRPLSRGDEY